MKIFINARFLTQPISGVQRYAIECSRQIKKLHTNVSFIAPPGILHQDIANELHVTVVGNRTGHLWEQQDLPRFLRKQGSPPLMNMANTAPLFYNNNYITIHDLAFYHHPEWNTKLFAAWYNYLMPRIARSSKHLFTVSQTMKDEITTIYHIPAEKVSITYNGLSQALTDQLQPQGYPKEKIILSVGSFNIRKNHHLLINAFLNSTIQHEYQLALIGDSHQVFKATGILPQDLAKENIKILSDVSEPELVNYFKRAEVIASLSEYEGFGIPVLEGLAYGCKAVCSDIKVYHELYDGYAYFCNPHDIKTVTNALQNACNEKSIQTKYNTSVLLEKYNYFRSAQTILENILPGHI